MAWIIWLFALAIFALTEVYYVLLLKYDKESWTEAKIWAMLCAVATIMIITMVIVFTLGIIQAFPLALDYIANHWKEMSLQILLSMGILIAIFLFFYINRLIAKKVRGKQFKKLG